MVILMMVVRILMSVHIRMLVGQEPFVQTLKAVIAATALKVMKAMAVRLKDVLIMMSVQDHHVVVMQSARTRMVVLSVYVQMVMRAIPVRDVKVSLSISKSLKLKLIFHFCTNKQIDVLSYASLSIYITIHYMHT